jgi:predicted NBD/HSP70 family sugar kinase
MKIERSQVFTYRALQDKDKKVLSILDLLTAKGVISRTEVSKATGVNIVSISHYINSLIGKNLVLETGLDVSTGGRKPELVELNAKENYVIGVDASGDIKALLADASMDIRSKVRLEGPHGGEELPAQISSAVETLCKKAGVARDSVKAIGIGSCAGNPDEGTSGNIKNRAALEVFSGDRLACAAYGEKRMNTSCREGALLYVHSSLGACVLIKDSECIEPAAENGESAGSVKYLRPWNEPLGVAHIARQPIAKGIGTAIVECARGNMENVTEEAVIEAASKGDEVASNILQNVGMNLGLRIAYLINLFEPETVVLGGGLERAGERILGPVRNTVMKFSLKTKAGSIKVVPASLGVDGVATGAAWLAVREIFLRA